MTRLRVAPFLFSILLLAAPARALWDPNNHNGPQVPLPVQLYQDGQRNVQQGIQNHNPAQILGGLIEEGVGALFGGKHRSVGGGGNGSGHGPNPDAPGQAKKNDPPPPEETPGPTIDPTAPAGKFAGKPSTPPTPPGETDPALKGGRPPTLPPPVPPPGDSTGLVQNDEGAKGPGNYAPPPQTPTFNSGHGSIVAAPTAHGRVAADYAFEPGAGAAHQPGEYASDVPGAAGAAAAGSGGLAAGAQAGGLSQHGTADNFLDKSVGAIQNVGGAEGDLARQSDALVAAAKGKMAVGDYHGAVDSLSRAIQLNPNNAQAWIKRAEAYNKLKNFAEAESDARTAVKLAPTSAAAWQNLAFALMRQGKLDEARRAIDQALALNDMDATSHYVRYLILGKMGSMKAAIAELERAAQLDSAKYGDLLEKVRSKGGSTFVDPDEESSLGDSARHVALGLPLWVWSLMLGFLLAGGMSAGLFLFLKSRKDSAPIAPLAKPLTVDPNAENRLAGKYEMLRIIGKGGMGNVYEAMDHSLGRKVAVKKMSERLSDMAPQAREMLVKEAKTVASLHHPAVVDIYEILQDNEDLYLVFELVKGKTAQHILAESGKLSLEKTLEILRPVCQALDFAHGREMVHRDLKPANIMITEQGFVKLMDFGIARSLGDRTAVAPAGPDASVQKPMHAFAQTTTVVGTPHYMAPEIERGIVSKQGDVYALGVCLYELTTGRLPFQTAPQKITLDIMKATGWRPELPAGIDDLIMESLNPDPEKRLASAKDFLARLEALVKASPAAPAGAPAAA